jgi:hypothetical protein
LSVVDVPGWYDVDDAVSFRMLEAELDGRRPDFVPPYLSGADAPATRAFVRARTGALAPQA